MSKIEKTLQEKCLPQKVSKTILNNVFAHFCEKKLLKLFSKKNSFFYFFFFFEKKLFFGENSGARMRKSITVAENIQNHRNYLGNEETPYAKLSDVENRI